MTKKFLITEIKKANKDVSKYSIRKASRGVLRWKNKIALLNVSKFNYHKLPGGGIDNSETNEKAFQREVLEETGCHCIIEDYSGVTIEYRDKFNLVQISYVFFANVIGKPGKVNFEQGEKDEGFILEWVPLEKVEEVLKTDNPTNYEGEFIHKRDSAIVNFYKARLFKK